ncbi:50S ribosomal protein L13 [Candidatus Uhrbacteria bacterium]|nr:50S ribosomal protein L13 [Candidatus Uhrbacteria bacterium]
MTYNVQRATHTLDATGKQLGRLASQIATLLTGKGKRTYRAEHDQGDYVVVQNIKSARFSGRKMDQKIAYHFSGYPGGLKETKWGTLFLKNPRKILHDAVARMLPKNRLQSERLNRLKIE